MKKYILQLMKNVGAIKFGDFTLASGKESKYYVDCRKVLLDSNGLSTISREMAKMICAEYPNVNMIGGPELGAVPLIGGILVQMATNLYRSASGFIVRKEAKKHGLMKMVEGFDEKDYEICVVEDTITTGGSVLRAINEVEKLGHKVNLIAAVFDRKEGAETIFKEKNIKFVSLLDINDLG